MRKKCENSSVALDEWSALRRLLAPYLLIEPQRVGLKLDAVLSLDVADLETAVAGAGAEETTTLARAVARYRGDFPEGFYVKGTLPFEEWMLAQRERLRQVAIGALGRLVAVATDAEQYAAGLSTAAACWMHLGAALCLASGEALAEAQKTLAESLRHFGRIQAPIGMSKAYYWQAVACLESGLTVPAEENFCRCIELSHQHGLMPLVIDGLVGLLRIADHSEVRHLTPLQAAAIPALALEYPATSAWTRSLAGRFAQELEVKNQARTSAGLAQIVAEVLP